MATIFPVILSFNNSNKLWPLSRKSFPSCLISTPSHKSPLQNLISNTASFNNPIIVCEHDHRFLIGEQLSAINTNPDAIIVQQESKNTMAATALAAIKALDIDNEAILLVLSPDHYIVNKSLFQLMIERAVIIANSGKMVILGIDASEPTHGSEYIIKSHYDEDAFPLVHSTYREESTPNNCCVTSSGKFVFKAKDYLLALEKHHPETNDSCISAMKLAQSDSDFIRIHEGSFTKSENHCVEYSLLGQSNNSWVISTPDNWMEKNIWLNFLAQRDTDLDNKNIDDDVILEDCTECSFISSNRLLTGIGLSDTIVIDTKDALLITEKNRLPDIQPLINRLKDGNRPEYITHSEVLRPWGSYEIIESGQCFQVKRLTINPCASLSLQKHYHRSEHWVIVNGTALVTLETEETLLTPNESIYIPIGLTHQLANPGKIPLHIIEIQIGYYLGEDDIVRYIKKGN